MERGLGVTLNDIAHHAGVGVGTVYRRFPDKARLIDELFEQRVEALVVVLEEALGDPDPWHGLIGSLETVMELQAANRALKEIVTSMPDGVERVCQIRDRLQPLGAELVRRAQQAGRLRADVAAEDLPIIQLMLSALMDASRDVEPELWRRFMALMIRGLSAEAGPPEPLAPGPLLPGQVGHIMSSSKASAR
jgi:AcrR family transcriptional regulator